MPCFQTAGILVTPFTRVSINYLPFMRALGKVPYYYLIQPCYHLYLQEFQFKVICLWLIIDVTTRIACDTSLSDEIIEVMMRVPMRPQSNFWVIHYQLIQIGAIPTIHNIVIAISRMSAQFRW